MAAKAGDHYGPAFQRHHGVTQGDPLASTIFKLVVDAVIQHWVTVVGGPQEVNKQEGLGTSIQDILVLFYANERVIESPESACLQGGFEPLNGLFNHAGLHTNEGKIVSMECQTCKTPHTWLMEDYTWRLKGRGFPNREQLRQRLNFLERRVDLAAGSLMAHHHNHKHGVGCGEATPPPPPKGRRGREG